MSQFNSMKTKLIFYLIISLIPVFAVLLYTGEGYIKNALYKNALLKAKTSASEAARDIEDLTFSISVKPREIANLTGERISHINKIKKLMIKNVKNNKFIYGMALAFLPKHSPIGGYFCQYYYLQDGRLLEKQLIPPLYNYIEYSWFKKPINLSSDIWSEPYFDKGGGNIWMSTYSAVIKNGKGAIIGIATADISIKFLSKIINRIKILQTGGAFLFTKSGDILAPLGDKAVMKNSISEILRKYNKQDFKDLAYRVFKGKNNYSKVNVNSAKYRIYYTPIRNTDWIIGVAFPENELFLPIKKMEIYSFFIIFIGLMVVVILIILVSKKVTKDIGKIKIISLEIANGNFDVEIPSGFGDESKDVAEALNTMQKSLKKYIKDVKEKARIENELKLAQAIQSSFIPNSMSVTVNGFDFKAISIWARQVGGDFYGINKIDKDRILFYLGDVSGKGIPAVLYVAMIKSMIEVLSKQTHSVKNITTFLNNYLAGITKHHTFATMFIGLIDKKENRMFFCNAGHLPPALFKNNAIYMPILSGNVPVGTFKGFDYKTDVLGLDMFDGLIIFSDGITDAIDSAGSQFGEDRLLNIIKGNLHSTGDIISSLEKELHNFIGSEDLYDDTTLLSIVKTPMP